MFFFLKDLHYKIQGIVLIGYISMNQMTCIGNFHIGFKSYTIPVSIL
jgi:hypothetical protein